MVRSVRRALLASSLLLAACAGRDAPAPPTLVLSAAQVSLRGQSGAPGLAEATVDLSTADGRAAQEPVATVAYPGEAGWLEVAVAPLGQAWRITLRTAAGALAAGRREATVTLTSPGAAGPAVVHVALDVDPAPPVLVVSAAAVTFSAEQGAADPAPQVLDVRLEGGTGPAPSVEVGPAGASSWLTATLAEVPAGWALTLAASVAGLAPGEQQATATVASAGATGSPVVVAVTFTVSPTTAALAVAPGSLQFSSTEGTSPPPQLLSAFAPTAAGLAAITVAVDPPGGAPWLAFTTAPASGRLDVGVQADASGLAPGRYQATLVVESPGLLDSPARVPVTLDVAPAIPALQVAPLALQFDSPFSNPPAAQTVAIAGVGLGVLPPVTVATTLHAGSGWLQVTPGGAGNAQNLRLQPTPSGFLPGTYRADVAVAAEGSAGSPATVAVALHVLAATGSKCPPGSTLAYLGGGGGAGGAEPADFASTFFTNYCTRCHDSAKVGLARNGALPGTDFDTLARARAVNPYNLDIYAAAGPTQIFPLMPPSGVAPTNQERIWLGQWIACGEP